MKKTAVAATLVSALLFSAVSGTLLVDLVKANGYIPSPDTKIEIYCPQNKTYTNSTITLSFYVWQAFWWRDFYYSLDGQEMKVVENVATTDEYNLNTGKNPPVIVANLRGSCVLGNLSEGWHNVTIYQIGDYPSGNPQNREVINSAYSQFRIATASKPEPFPVVPVAAASAAVAVGASAGSLVYFRKRKRQAPNASPR